MFCVTGSMSYGHGKTESKRKRKHARLATIGAVRDYGATRVDMEQISTIVVIAGKVKGND